MAFGSVWSSSLGGLGDGSSSMGCRDHPDESLIEDSRSGEMVCGRCGLVGDRIVDPGSEWRNFSDSARGNQSRVGGPENPLLDGDENLSTVIGIPKNSFKGANDLGGAPLVTSRGNPEAKREGVTRMALNAIEQMCEHVGLQRVTSDRASVLFKEMADAKQTKGRNNEAMAAACIYMACGEQKIPRTFKEICKVSKATKRDIGQSYKTMLATLNTAAPEITNAEYIARFCKNLKLPKNVEKAAVCIADTAQQLEIASGKSPVSIMGAAIYMASQASETKVDQKAIAEEVHVSAMTIRQTYKILYKEAKDLFPPDFEVDLYRLPLK